MKFMMLINLGPQARDFQSMPEDEQKAFYAGWQALNETAGVTPRALNPVGARYSPKTSRRTADHSPVVTPERAQARVASIRLTSGRAASARS